MVNFAELDPVLDHLDAHPQQVNMGTWYRVPEAARLRPGHLADDWQCGTVACLAGWTAIRAGWVPIFGNGILDLGVMVNPATGERALARDVARDILELSYGQASALFCEATTLGEVHTMVDALRHDPNAEDWHLISLVRDYESLES